MERPRPDRNPRGVRVAGAVESARVRTKGVGDQRGDHQRDGRLDRHRPSVWRHRWAAGDDAGERNEAPQRAVRPDLGLRAGRHGVGDRAGAFLMPALQWRLEDGVAVVTLDTPNAAVNVISQAVKQELLAALDTLEHAAA